MAVEPGVDDERVGHGDAFGFHGMFFGVDELAEVRVVEVGDLALSFDIHSGLIIYVILVCKEGKLV